MIAHPKDLLGVGIYTPAEAAMYARVRPQLINRWLFGDSKGEPVIQAQLGRSDEKIVTFLDLVQTLAIRAIRTQFPQISLGKIKCAAESAERIFKIRYPFAMPHRTLVFNRGEDSADLRSPRTADQDREDENSPKCEIVFDDDRGLTQLTGENAGNRMIAEVAELYLTDLTFNEQGLASRDTPFRRGALAVTMDPQKHFGEPLLPSGYTALTLLEAVKVEGSMDAAAKVYGVDITEVELACGYFDFLQAPVPA